MAIWSDQMSKPKDSSVYKDVKHRKAKNLKTVSIEPKKDS